MEMVLLHFKSNEMGVTYKGILSFSPKKDVKNIKVSLTARLTHFVIFYTAVKI